jgi:broad specificity phosphatase PhoE
MTLHLVRHPPVARGWQKRCYGQSDPGLSRAGAAMVGPLVDQLAVLDPAVVIHSDMRRTRAVAEPLVLLLGRDSIASPLWRERDFGAWEGTSWHRIYRETGNAMDGMTDDPHRFRPGGGETTAELAARIAQAISKLPDAERIVVITHGGPIACAVAHYKGIPLHELASLVPGTCSITTL